MNASEKFAVAAYLANKLPVTLPENAEQYLTSQGAFRNANALIYRHAFGVTERNPTRHKCVSARCTRCGQEQYFDRADKEMVRHLSYGNTSPFSFYDPINGEALIGGMETTCPACGAKVQIFHISDVPSDGRVIASESFLSTYRLGTSVAFLSWTMEKIARKDGSMTTVVSKDNGFLLTQNRLFSVRGYKRSFYSCFQCAKWYALKRFSDEIGAVHRARFLPVPSGFFDGTCLENAALPGYFAGAKSKIYLGAYLRLYFKYPSIENVVKSGYAGYLTKVLEKATDGYRNRLDISCVFRFLDLKKTRLCDILGLNRDERHLMELSPERVELYRLVRDRFGIRLGSETLKKADNLSFLRDILTGTYPFRLQVLRMFSYLERQRCGTLYNHGIYLRDYWNALRIVYPDSVPQELLFPKDLKQAHDRMTAMAKNIVDIRAGELIADRGRRLQHLSFRDEKAGLFIRPCMSQEELITEGKVLHHCVATYAQDVASGKTSIFFVRKISAPDEPYYTLEWRDGEIKQDHTIYNRVQTPGILAFEKEWLDFMRGGKKNGTGTETRRAYAGRDAANRAGA